VTGLRILMGTTLWIFLSGCQVRTFELKDSGIVTTPTESQGGSAFCWSYAIVAHLEQRHFERTRGETRGGFRLNLSEEYLGLMHILAQLVESRSSADFSGEGLRLGLGLDRLDRFGIVPEKILGRVLFKAKFQTLIGPKVLEKALFRSNELGGKWPLEISDAADILAEVAGLSSEQLEFLRSSYLGDSSKAGFQFASKRYTPQSFLKEHLRFERNDYFVLQLPKSGKLSDGTGSFSDEYIRTLKIIQKAILYGYSVPISFNFLSNSKFANGELKCNEADCPFADLAGSDNPHSNHAVLALDYRAAGGSFGVPDTSNLAQSIESVPKAWLIKNSWGFNQNTRRDPDLLKRFPVPAYTVMHNDFYATSHRLNPGRYEAIIPKKLCIRSRTNRGLIHCEDLIRAAETAGLPKPAETNLAVNSELLGQSLSQIVHDRMPVSLTRRTDGADSPKYALNYADPARTPVTEILPRINFMGDTESGKLIEDRLHLCLAITGPKDIRLVAVYIVPQNSNEEALPSFLLTEDAGWQHCTVLPNEKAQYRVVLQGIDARWKTRSQLSGRLVLSGD
jgi:hypothetical protein